ncbi:MAG: Sugar transporter SemiSWEET [bacterium]|nr:Sugar transporter SemiSWEET [bacterium]
MNYVTLIGLTAATLTTSAFLPQVIKSWQTKSAKDLSLGMFVIFCSGVFLWLIYGLLSNDLPLILSNAVTFILALTILILKIRHG